MNQQSPEVRELLKKLEPLTLFEQEFCLYMKNMDFDVVSQLIFVENRRENRARIEMKLANLELDQIIAGVK